MLHSKLSTFIIKAEWRATSKLLKIEAEDSDSALAKAARRSDIKNKGCLKLTLISER